MENNNIRYIVGNSQNNPALLYSNSGVEASVSFKRYFVNHTNRTISVVDRNGLRFRVEKVMNDYRQSVIIRTEYVVPGRAYDDIQSVLNHVIDRPDNYPDLMALRDALFAKPPRDRFKQHTVIIDTVVSQSVFEKQNSVYVSNMDVVLTTLAGNEEVVHPFGKPALITEWYQKQAEGCQGVSTFVEIVDNDNQIGNRFIYMTKRVFEVPAIKDTTRESGIYLCCIEKRPGFESAISSIRFDLTEGEDKLGLYKTQEDAVSDGDVKARRDETIAKLKYEMQTTSMAHDAKIDELNREHELVMIRIKADNVRVESENKQKDLKLEEFKREREQERSIHELRVTTLKTEYETAKMRDAHNYDKESSKIKIKNEVIKLSATAITSGLAIWILMLKYGNKDK